MRKCLIGLMMMVCLGGVGCAGPIPTDSYIPQNHVKYNRQNSVAVGNFLYSPTSETPIAPNQIQNTAMGSIYISTSVADLVKRATAMELEKTGLKLNEHSPIVIDGNVLEFKADDLGFSVDWTYVINYKILNQADKFVIYESEYRPSTKKTGKFGSPSELGAILNEVVLSGYEMFIKDPKVRMILDEDINLTMKENK